MRSLTSFTVTLVLLASLIACEPTEIPASKFKIRDMVVIISDVESFPGSISDICCGGFNGGYMYKVRFGHANASDWISEKDLMRYFND